MYKQALKNRYRIYIPNHVLSELRITSGLYVELLADGATIYQATGYWHGESEDVSVHEIFGESGSLVGVKLEHLAQELLWLGEEAVLIDMNGIAMLYSEAKQWPPAKDNDPEYVDIRGVIV